MRRERTLHGRRQGRRLRPGQRRLVEELYPRLAVPVPPDGARIDPFALFDPRPKRLWFEVGFGGGEHLAAQARDHREIGFIGCEPYLNGLAKMLASIESEGLENVRVLADDARPLLAALPDRCLDRVFVLFPDPWPKSRHHKRRFVAPAALDELARVMADGAELRLATDDDGYLRWMLEHLLAHADFDWLARGPRDWRVRPADWPETRYESKAAAAGRTNAFLRFARSSRR